MGLPACVCRSPLRADNEAATPPQDRQLPAARATTAQRATPLSLSRASTRRARGWNNPGRGRTRLPVIIYATSPLCGPPARRPPSSGPSGVPSIRHSGGRTCPACGTFARRAGISGSAANAAPARDRPRPVASRISLSRTHPGADTAETGQADGRRSPHASGRPGGSRPALSPPTSA